MKGAEFDSRSGPQFKLLRPPGPEPIAPPTSVTNASNANTPTTNEQEKHERREDAALPHDSVSRPAPLRHDVNLQTIPRVIQPFRRAFIPVIARLNQDFADRVFALSSSAGTGSPRALSCGANLRRS